MVTTRSLSRLTSSSLPSPLLYLPPPPPLPFRKWSQRESPCLLSPTLRVPSITSGPTVAYQVVSPPLPHHHPVMVTRPGLTPPSPPLTRSSTRYSHASTAVTSSSRSSFSRREPPRGRVTSSLGSTECSLGVHCSATSRGTLPGIQVRTVIYKAARGRWTGA